MSSVRIVPNDCRVVPAAECSAVIVGPVCKPHNDLMKQDVGSDHKAIHDDETARAAGFAAAPIHGTVHWSQLTPLLLEAFGTRWFEHGSVSVHFRNTVGHLEPVRAFVGQPAPGQTQVRIWMEKEDPARTRVFDGTASCDAHDTAGPSMVQQRIMAVKPLATPPALMRFNIGERSKRESDIRIEFGTKIGKLFPYTVEEKNRIITEPHPWFTQESGHTSPWGRAVLSPELLNAIMFYTSYRAHWQQGGRLDTRPVGMFGGCEARMINGPVFVGESYDLDREVVAIGETPKTEYVWTRTRLYAPGTDTVVATMDLQQMSLKATLPSYADERAAIATGKQPNAKL